MLTFSEENYLKAIYHLQQKTPQGANTNALAQRMETQPSSVTDMLKKLNDKKLVNYRKYQGAKLSKTGEETAIKVIRRHRLWEVFLVEKLNFAWDEVHEIAEQLEHIRSHKLTAELDRFLNFPKRDPHGDPIPDAEGNFMVDHRLLLAELQPGEKGVFVGVKDSSSSFLKYLDTQNISLGKTIQVVEKVDFDRSMEIEIEGVAKHLSNMATANIYLKTD